MPQAQAKAVTANLPLIWQWLLPALAGTAAVLLLAATAQAQRQQVNVGTPVRSAGDSFYESTNIGWSLQGNGWFARFGGGGTPPYGGFQPGAGISGGSGFGGNGFSGNLFFNSSQGGSRNLSSFTPSVTTLNGYPGTFISGVQRPFVTGLVPTVGIPPQFSVPAPSLQQRLNELRLREAAERAGQSTIGPATGETALNQSAGRFGGSQQFAGGSYSESSGSAAGAGASIDPLPLTRAEREARQEAVESATEAAARQYYTRGLKARAEGKASVARQYFRMAASRSEGELQQLAREELNQLNPR
ncbi:MAG: hypothetical protein KDA79_20075 [Planctomycetaceae bacterium]|nr:hypothetical protein [Planctomycetaceae bacterium]